MPDELAWKAQDRGDKMLLENTKPTTLIKPRPSGMVLRRQAEAVPSGIDSRQGLVVEEEVESNGKIPSFHVVLDVENSDFVRALRQTCMSRYQQAVWLL